MLVPEAITLAIMKWRLAQLSPAIDGYRSCTVHRLLLRSARRSRWRRFPSAPVTDMGAAGTNGHWQRPRARRPARCGTVVEVLFDCHGDFCGFVLDECCVRHVFETRERAIGELVLRVCLDGMRLCVTVDEECGKSCA